MTVRLARAGRGEVLVEAAVDPAWLSDPARVFPVRVDPTVVVDTTRCCRGDTTIDSRSNTSEFFADSLDVGMGSLLNQVRRSLITIDVALPPGAQVSSATLRLDHTWAPTCTPTTFLVERNTLPWGPDTRWASKPATTAADPPPAAPQSSTRTRSRAASGPTPQAHESQWRRPAAR